MTGTVLYERDGAVATLTLSRAERLNAIVPELIDGAIRGVRLRGAGRAFCAGYDIKWGAGATQTGEEGAPWDPIADHRMMSRSVRASMRLWALPAARDRVRGAVARRDAPFGDDGQEGG